MRSVGWPFRAWLAVHSTRAAIILLALTGVISIAASNIWLFGIGAIAFRAPVSLLLISPALAGISMAVGVTLNTSVPTPETRATLLARAAWIATLAGGAFLAVSPSCLTGGISLAAVVRNVLLYGSLSLIIGSLGGVSLTWLPTFGLILTGMLFGHHSVGREYSWWAVFLDRNVTLMQFGCISSLFLISAAIYVFAPMTKWTRAHNRST